MRQAKTSDKPNCKGAKGDRGWQWQAGYIGMGAGTNLRSTATRYTTLHPPFLHQRTRVLAAHFMSCHGALNASHSAAEGFTRDAADSAGCFARWPLHSLLHGCSSHGAACPAWGHGIMRTCVGHGCAHAGHIQSSAHSQLRTERRQPAWAPLGAQHVQRRHRMRNWQSHKPGPVATTAKHSR